MTLARWENLDIWLMRMQVCGSLSWTPRLSWHLIIVSSPFLTICPWVNKAGRETRLVELCSPRIDGFDVSGSLGCVWRELFCLKRRDLWQRFSWWAQLSRVYTYPQKYTIHHHVDSSIYYNPKAPPTDETWVGDSPSNVQYPRKNLPPTKGKWRYLAKSFLLTTSLKP
jgi:hypothetical protein